MFPQVDLQWGGGGSFPPFRTRGSNYVYYAPPPPLGKMEMTIFVWLHGAAAHTPLEPPLLLPFKISGSSLSQAIYHKLCLATTLVALNTIVVYSWTITIEQPHRLVEQVN